MLGESSGTNDFITELKTKLFGDLYLRSTIVSSCRTYQLIFILILLFFDKYHKEGAHLTLTNVNARHAVNPRMAELEGIANAINVPEKYKDNPYIQKLHEIIAQNTKTVDVVHVTDFDGVRGYYEIGPLKIWPLCIYRFRDSLCITRGAIAHYFTIIEYNSVFYLSSSYGSNYVNLSPHIIEIDLEELNLLFSDLEKIKTLDSQEVEKIMNIYRNFFLPPKGKPVCYDEDDIDLYPCLRFQQIYPAEGIEKECGFIEKNNHNFRVGLINNYVEYLKGLLNAPPKSKDGGKSKKRKSKKRKSRKSKKRKSKKKLTKRRYKRKSKSK